MSFIKTNDGVGATTPPPNANNTQPIPIIGISASTGETNQLIEFFDSILELADLAFVLVSTTPEAWPPTLETYILQHKHWNYAPLQTGVTPQANTIYVCEAGTALQLNHGILQSQLLEAGSSENATNVFFQSLAQEQQNLAVGLIFSRTGSINKSGSVAIQSAGGLVVLTANATINNLEEDFETALPHLIYPLLASHLGLTGQTEGNPILAAEQTEKALHAIYELLMQAYGVDFQLYNNATLLRRLEKRITVGGHGSIDEYLATLVGNHSELALLYKDLLIGVTSFFRDAEAFQFIQDAALPSLLNDSSINLEIRIWVPACSTGEEAYTFAIIMLELLQQHPTKKLKLIATDLNEDSIKIASDGIYSPDIISSIPQPLLVKYFDSLDNGNYKVTTRLRSSIVFSTHNILTDIPFHRMDLISCRNFLIYLNKAAQKKVLNSLHFSLKINGVLMLGAGESLREIENDFFTLNKNWRIYQKVSNSQQHLRLNLDKLIKQKTDNAPIVESRNNRIYDALLGKHIPPSILIDEKRHVLHLFGKVNRYLHPAEGRQSNDLLSMLNNEVRPAISSLIHTSFSNNRSATMRNIEIIPGQHVDIGTELITDTISKSRFILLIIRDHETFASPAEAAIAEANTLTIDKNLENLLQTLEKELTDSRTALQTVMAEMDSTTEELQASNEELVASNEALQSSNEELHSVNAELYSVNAELQEKIKENDHFTADIKNLIEYTNSAIIFTDENLRLRLYTPLVTKILNILPQDLGRPLTHLSSLSNDDELATTLDNNSPFQDLTEKVIRTHSGETFLRRISRYMDKIGNIRGFVIVYTDITEIAKSREDALLRERKLEEITNAVPMMLFTSDAFGRFTFANTNFLQYTGLTREEALSGDNPSLIHPDDQEQAREDWAKTLSSQPVDAAHRIRRHDGEYRWFRVQASPMYDSSGSIYQWLGSFIDIHDSRSTYDQLNHMVQSAPLAIITVDQAGIIKQANSQTLLWTGYTRTELIDNNIEVLLEPHARLHHRSFLASYAEHPTARVMSGSRMIHLQRKNGEKFPVEIGLSPITIAGRLHIAVFITDLTIQLHAEATLKSVNESLERAIALRAQALVENEKRLELAIRSASLGIFDWDLLTNQVSFNQRMFDIIGIPATQDMTVPHAVWQQCVVEEDLKVQMQLFHEAEQKQKPEIESTYRIHRYDTGELRYLHSNRTVFFDSHGKAIRIIGMLRDITTEHKSEQALRETTLWLEERIKERTQELSESEARFRIMADNSPILFFLADAAGNLTWLNRTWQSWSGRDITDEQNHGWLNHIHLDDQQRVRKTLSQQDPSVESSTLEFRLKDNAGKYGWLYLQSTPMHTANGALKGFLVSCTDISWQKEREEEQKRIEKKLEETAKLDSLGLMAGGVAHDFNNLLTGILGNIELAQWETNGEQALLKTVLADARTATLRAADLCKQMLAYSGKGHFATDNCDFNAIITETLRFISASIKPGVKVVPQLDDNLPEVIADRVQLQQIIMNLTINAGEAIPEQGVVIIRTGLTSFEHENDHNIVITDIPLSGPAAYIEVEDNGTGMTPEELSKAFEPFFTTKFVGRGLGLSAVLGIMKGHNGSLSVKTTKGVGTTMRVALPLQQEHNTANTAPAPKQDLRLNSKILIVDDEEIVARTLQRYLDHLRVPSEYVLSGRECLTRISTEPKRYDLVILDLTMSGIDGYETFTQLRKIEPTLKVVLISGFSESEATRKFNPDELAGFLPKPISEKALSDLIKRLRF
jgi:PAS domain S-box-containing protein